MHDPLALSIILIIGFLTVAMIASILLKKLRFPYTIGLVIIGFFAGILIRQTGFDPLRDVMLTPEIILYLILPTLIYDAAINMDLKALRMNIVPILLLAIFGLLISLGIIGGLLSVFSVFSIGAAFLFGALISATDPVAVIGLFNEVGAPRRLGTLLDGESIFNDATAIVLFSIISLTIARESVSTGELIAGSMLNFVRVLFGGLIIGVVVGGIGSLLTRMQKDHSILQIVISLIMAYVSFIAAEMLSVSGVMSTLAAGITVSLFGTTILENRTRFFLEHFWEFFSFVANSFVFLLLGLTEAGSFSNWDVILQSLMILLIVIPVVSLARGVAIAILIPLYNRFTSGEKISPAYQFVLFWGGLRGAVPVALVLAISPDFPGRDLIVNVTFGYILFTLLVQGTTVKTVMNLLKIHSEKGYYDYHEGISFSLKLPTAKLLELLKARVLDAFVAEGFFIGEEQSDKSRLLSRGQKFISIGMHRNDMILTAADQEDLAYCKQMVYETLLDLNNSISSLRDIIKSPALPEIIRSEESVGNKATLNIAKYLDKDLIRLSLSAEDKTGVITELVDIAAAAGAISHRDDVLQAVFDREASMSTGFDNGVAIPHAKIDGPENIVLVIGIKKTGIEFESLDGKPARLFFLIISPKSQVGPHIQLLAEIARKMGNPEIREGIIEAGDASEIISRLKQR
jgi:Na+/H+ antiporter